MAEKPGVMIYFDMIPAMQELSDADAGILFKAILVYGKTRKVGPLTRKTKVIWPLVQQRLDADNLRYERTIFKRKYAAYVRWAKGNNQDVMEYDAWIHRITIEEEKKKYGTAFEKTPIYDLFLQEEGRYAHV